MTKTLKCVFRFKTKRKIFYKNKSSDSLNLKSEYLKKLKIIPLLVDENLDSCVWECSTPNLVGVLFWCIASMTHNCHPIEIYKRFDKTYILHVFL